MLRSGPDSRQSTPFTPGTGGHAGVRLGHRPCVAPIVSRAGVVWWTRPTTRDRWAHPGLLRRATAGRDLSAFPSRPAPGTDGHPGVRLGDRPCVGRIVSRAGVVWWTTISDERSAAERIVVRQTSTVSARGPRRWVRRLEGDRTTRGEGRVHVQASVRLRSSSARRHWWLDRHRPGPHTAAAREPGRLSRGADRSRISGCQVYDPPGPAPEVTSVPPRSRRSAS